MTHDYQFISAHGEDAPNKSIDEYYYCSRCGTLKHDYRHNGGRTSPNFPLFMSIGNRTWSNQEPPSCLRRPLTSAIYEVERHISRIGDKAHMVVMTLPVIEESDTDWTVAGRDGVRVVSKKWPNFFTSYADVKKLLEECK